MENKANQFLTEIKELLKVATGKYALNDLADVDQFIAQFKKQEQTIEEIGLRLANFRGIYELMEEKEQHLVEQLKTIMNKQEEARLFFQDWGDPLAVFFQQQTVIKELETTLNIEV